MSVLREKNYSQDAYELVNLLEIFGVMSRTDLYAMHDVLGKRLHIKNFEGYTQEDLKQEEDKRRFLSLTRLADENVIKKEKENLYLTTSLGKAVPFQRELTGAVKRIYTAEKYRTNRYNDNEGVHMYINRAGYEEIVLLFNKTFKKIFVKSFDLDGSDITLAQIEAYARYVSESIDGLALLLATNKDIDTQSLLDAIKNQGFIFITNGTVLTMHRKGADKPTKIKLFQDMPNTKEKAAS